MSAARNQRLAWLAQELSKGKTNAAIVLDCMTKFPNVSEKTVRKELKELLQRLTDIEMECLPEVKTRFLEIGFKLLEECRSLAQMSAAVNQFKALAQMSGVLSEKPAESTSGPSNGSPESIIVRERIKQLMKNKNIREQAEAAGIDLDELAKDGE